MIKFDYYRPKILVSRCLEFASCRYDGQIIKNSLIYNLKNMADFHTVCPEADIGMGIPRPTIRIELFDETKKLYQSKTGEDFLPKMREYSEDFISKKLEFDGIILKAKSPSCGLKGIPVYKSGNKTQEKTSGIFAGIILDNYKQSFIEDEGRLNNFIIRENYLTKLFSLAHFKALKMNLKMKELVDFHAAYKYLFMSFNQDKMRKMGRVVANHEALDLPTLFENYETLLFQLFEKSRNKRNTVNVLQHIFGYFKSQLNSSEKEHFLDLVERYKKNEIPLFICNQILTSWVLRFNQNYLLKQRFFEPFPEILMDGAQKETI